MSPAVTVGSLNLDLIVAVHRLPGRGETVVGTRTESGPGGKGANQAAAAGALCPDVAMVGRVGDDSAGLSSPARRRGATSRANWPPWRAGSRPATSS
jgi:ribokinase